MNAQDSFVIAVCASGEGTNFQALVDRSLAPNSGYRVGLLICDRPGAAVIAKAERANIPTWTASPKKYAAKDLYEAELVLQLQRHRVELVVLAGYMRLVGAKLLQSYTEKIINIHPSLLPSFPGLDAIGQALAHGVKITGSTVHFVDQGMDTGPIIAQQAIEIGADENMNGLKLRIQAIEHQLLPCVIEWFAAGRVEKCNQHVRVHKHRKG